MWGGQSRACAYNLPTAIGYEMRTAGQLSARKRRETRGRCRSGETKGKKELGENALRRGHKRGPCIVGSKRRAWGHWPKGTREGRARCSKQCQEGWLAAVGRKASEKEPARSVAKEAGAVLWDLGGEHKGLWPYCKTENRGSKQVARTLRKTTPIWWHWQHRHGGTPLMRHTPDC